MRNERSGERGREAGWKEAEGERGESAAEGKRKIAWLRERREAAGKTGSIRAAFEPSVAQYLEPFSRN